MRKMRILVVDDNQDVREVVVEMVASLGHEVLQAGSGAEALATLRESREPVDVLLTDKDMPGMKGPELIHRSKREKPGMAAILMTGDHLSLAAKVAIYRSGADDILSKPVPIDALAAALERACQKPRSTKPAR